MNVAALEYQELKYRSQYSLLFIAHTDPIGSGGI
jgi:hypothetical protein